MEVDGAMLIPQNRNPSTGRAGTPSKGVTPTPQRTGSAGRPISTGRSGSAKTAALAARALSRGVSRSGAVSRRKLRKWEMDNLFGIGPETTRALFADSDIDDDGGIKNFGLTVDWRCLFSELFRGQNETARASFLACEDSVYQAPQFASRFNRLSTELKAGELAWLRVPKKLRPVLQRAVEADAELTNSTTGPIEYIRALESVIFYFVDTGYPAPVATLPEALTDRLAEPLSLKEAPVFASKEGSEDEDGWVHVRAEADASPPGTPHMGLEIVLEDSALHRLLLHAIVQYHGLHTRSYDADGQRCDNGVRQEKKQKKRSSGKNKSKNDEKSYQPDAKPTNTNRKAILIYRGKKSLKSGESILSVADSPTTKLSLVSFLQYKQKQRDDSRMQLLMQQMSLATN